MRKTNESNGLWLLLGMYYLSLACENFNRYLKNDPSGVNQEFFKDIQVVHADLIAGQETLFKAIFAPLTEICKKYMEAYKDLKEGQANES